MIKLLQSILQRLVSNFLPKTESKFIQTFRKKILNIKKCEEFAKTKGNEFVKHTNFQLIRIYPHAVNQLSQNYDPIMPWANGCQVGTVHKHKFLIISRL